MSMTIREMLITSYESARRHRVERPNEAVLAGLLLAQSRDTAHAIEMLARISGYLREVADQEREDAAPDAPRLRLVLGGASR